MTLQRLIGNENWGAPRPTVRETTLRQNFDRTLVAASERRDQACVAAAGLRVIHNEAVLSLERCVSRGTCGRKYSESIQFECAGINRKDALLHVDTH